MYLHPEAGLVCSYGYGLFVIIVVFISVNVFVISVTVTIIITTCYFVIIVVRFIYFALFKCCLHFMHVICL